MILTVTMNPSVDISYPLLDFRINEVNRVIEVSKTAGGKGLNVARVLSLLGTDVIATGLLGGHLGAYILDVLDQEGVKHDFYLIDQESRNSIAILHDGKQTEILESGPKISEAERDGFMDHLRNLLNRNKIDLITISGSLPVGLDQGFYSKLIDLAVGIPTLLDTSGEALRLALNGKVKPYLIKPNLSELSSLLSFEQGKEDEIVQSLKSSLFDGVEWIVVSLGSEGAIARKQNDFYRLEVPKVKAENSVGSGDATLAGLAFSIVNRCSAEATLKNAMTTGILNALERRTGYINPEYFQYYFERIKTRLCLS